MSGGDRKRGAALTRRRIAMIVWRGQDDRTWLAGGGEGPTAQEISHSLENEAHHRPAAISVAECVREKTLLDERRRRPAKCLNIAPRTRLDPRRRCSNLRRRMPGDAELNSSESAGLGDAQSRPTHMRVGIT